MKMNMKTLLTIMLTGMTLFLANCSKSNGSNTAAATTTQCVSTNYGCLPTTNCTQYGTNYGYYNGQCIQGTLTTTSTASTVAPTCNGMSGYVSVWNQCLPESTCSAYRGRNGIAYYAYYNGLCYPQGYTGQAYQ